MGISISLEPRIPSVQTPKIERRFSFSGVHAESSRFGSHCPARITDARTYATIMCRDPCSLVPHVLDRSLPQARVSLESARAEKRVADADTLQDKVDILEAAQAWERRKLVVTKLATLQDNYAILQEHGYTPWFKHRVLFTTRVATELLNAKDIPAWIKAVTPISRRPILPPPEWDCGAPTFMALFFEYSDMSEEDQKTNAFVLTSWQDSIINDVFLRYLSEEQKQGHDPVVAAEAWEMAEAFLTEAQKVPQERCPEYLKDSLKEVMRTFLGMVALLSPKPNALGSTPFDVDWLLDRQTIDQADTINSSGLKLKKSITKRIKKTPFWKQMATDYDQTSGAYATHGEDILHLEQLAARIMAEWETKQRHTQKYEASAKFKDDFAHIMEKTVENIARWQEDLRPGATTDLEELVVKLADMLTAALRLLLEGSDADVEDRSRALDTLRAISVMLPLLRGKSGLSEKLLQTVAGLLASWSEKD